MKKIQRKAFTLVELIVVMIILAILATVSFLGLSSYPGQARDSVRISDLHSIRKSLEVYKIINWKYPVPDNSISEVDSSWVIWLVWDFSEWVFSEIKNISKLPKEPGGINYKYILGNDNKVYKIKTVLENTWENYILTNDAKNISGDLLETE